MCSAETAYRLIVLVLAACGGAAPEAAPPEPAVLSAPAAAESTAEDATDAAESLKTEYPLTIDNCGLTYTYDAPPERGITMNQASTEVMLVLGLADKNHRRAEQTLHHRAVQRDHARHSQCGCR